MPGDLNDHIKQQMAEFEKKMNTNIWANQSTSVPASTLRPYVVNAGIPRDPKTMFADMYKQCAAEMEKNMVPKLVDFLARNFACGCAVDHASECAWGGPVKDIKKKLMGCIEPMKLADKLTQ